MRLKLFKSLQGSYNPGSGGGSVNVSSGRVAYGDTTAGDLTSDPAFTYGVVGTLLRMSINGSLYTPTKNTQIVLTNGIGTRSITLASLGPSISLADTATSQTMSITEGQIQFTDTNVSGTLSKNSVVIVNNALSATLSATSLDFADTNTSRSMTLTEGNIYFEDGLANCAMTNSEVEINNGDASNLMSYSSSRIYDISEGLSAEHTKNGFTAYSESGNDTQTTQNSQRFKAENVVLGRSAEIACETAGDTYLRMDDGTDDVYLRPNVSTGTATATFTAANKPGATNVTEPVGYLSFIRNGTQYWIPLLAD